MDVIDSINEILKPRPFFSIIIPCYNSKPERLRVLLQSICGCKCYNDIEIIISDGGSTDKSYLDEIDRFIKESEMDTKIVYMPEKNEDGIELIHCPGNTREYGVQFATGRWITFIDHDDCFVDGALDIVKDAIEETQEKYYICSNILEVDGNNNELVREIKYATNWMHGKFYNMDNLWKPFDIHYKTNMFSNEDIAISSRMNCIIDNIYGDDKRISWIDKFVYIWKNWEDCTSQLLYDDGKNYMENFFDEYVYATYGIYVDEYNKLLESGKEFNKELYMSLQANTLLYQYMYLQNFKFTSGGDKSKIEELIKNNIKDFYKRFNVDRQAIFDYAIMPDDNIVGRVYYNTIREHVTRSCGEFIEADSLKEFIMSVEV